MPETTVRIALAVLAAVFAWAALAKAIRWRRWTDALTRYELPAWIARPALVGVPLAEGAVATLTLIGRGAAGAILALVLLVSFTIVVMSVRSEAVPCGCFGGTAERSASTVLLRNVALSLPAAVVLSAERRPGLFEGVAAPRGGDLVPALLLVVGLALSAWLVRMVLSGGRSQ